MESKAIEFEQSDAILQNPGCGIMYLQRGKEKVPFDKVNPESWFLKEKLTNKIAIALPWSVIEPQQGQYLWQHPAWEGCFQSWIDNGFKVALQIRGMATLGTFYNDGVPQWVFDAGAKYVDEPAEYYQNTWLLNDKPDKDFPIRYPVYWDPVYLEKVEQLVTAFGQRYNGSKDIEFVSIGHMGRWGEMHIAEHNPIEPWIEAGLSTRNYIDAHKQIIDIYRKAFADTPLVQELARPVFGPKAEDPCMYDFDDVVEILEHLVKNRVNLKNNGFGSNYSQKQSFADTYCQAPTSYLDSDIGAIFQKYRDKVKVMTENLIFPEAYEEILKHHHISYWHGGGEPAGLVVDKIEKDLSLREKYFSAVPFYHEQYAKLEKDVEAQKNIWRRMAKECGYRIWPQKMQIIQKEKQRDFTTKITWKNSGSAACYENFQIELGLLDSNGKVCQILSNKPDIGCGPLSWPKAMSHEDTLNWQIPDELAGGKYQLGLALRHTNGEPISLAIDNKIAEGFYNTNIFFTI